MLSFGQAGKNELIAKLEVHAMADNFVKGQYWSDGKGCAVGCTLHDYGVDPGEHIQYEKLFGIPRVIAHLEDRIFEGLSIEESKAWPRRFSNAVPVNKDLSEVWPKFAIALMVDKDHGVIKYAKTDKQRKIILDCADLYSDGLCLDVKKAEDVRRRAYAAASASASAASYADASAAYAAASASYADASASYADAAYAADAAAAASYAADASAYAASYAARKSYFTWMADKLVEILEAA